MTTRTKNNTLAEIAEFLKTLNRVAVTTHVGSDGDAIGASAALVRLMRDWGLRPYSATRKGHPSIWDGSCPTSPCSSFRRITTFSSPTHPARTEPAYPCRKRALVSTSTTTRTTLSTPSTTW